MSDKSDKSDKDQTPLLFEHFSEEKESENLDRGFNIDVETVKFNTDCSTEKDSGLSQNSSNEIAQNEELETFSNNNINSINENFQFCEGGKNQEKIITLENKPYLLDKNNKILKEIDQEYEDKIYNNIFSNKLEIDQVKPFNITKFNE